MSAAVMAVPVAIEMGIRIAQGLSRLYDYIQQAAAQKRDLTADEVKAVMDEFGLSNEEFDNLQALARDNIARKARNLPRQPAVGTPPPEDVT